MTATLECLTEDREILTDELADCDGGFPGSKGWLRQAKAIEALAAFDALHPEVIVAIRAAHSARVSREHPYQD